MLVVVSRAAISHNDGLSVGISPGGFLGAGEQSDYIYDTLWLVLLQQIGDGL